jgi:hypothetical protein
MKFQVPPEQLEFMRRGVSVIVASRDASLRPSVMRAVGSDVAADGGTVTVFIARSQARQLLQDIAATGQLAVVFSEPSTHRSLQLKGAKAALRNATHADEPLLARYVASMENELTQVHIPPAITRAMLAHRIDDVVAVSFEPAHGFDQTPGPRAGTDLGATAS